MVGGTGITLTYVDASNTLTIARDALSASDIPDLSANKITSDTFSTARLAAGGTDGQVLTRTASGMAWEDATGGNAGISLSDSPPSEPDDGALWVDTTNLELFVYYDDGDTEQWVGVRSPLEAEISLEASDIPDLDADKITSGTFDTARLASDGTDGQVLTRTADGMAWEDAETGTDLSTADTDDLSEGSTNLYFTNTRADNRIASWARANSPSGTIPDARIPASIARDSEIPSSTSDLSEGTNRYFTNERVDDRVNALLTEGGGITLTYSDSANTLTIASETVAVFQQDSPPTSNVNAGDFWYEADTGSHFMYVVDSGESTGQWVQLG